MDNINKMMSIEVYNEDLESVGKLSESKMQYDSNSNVICYSKIGDWNENFSNGLKVSDTKNGDQYLIPFEKSFSTKTYDYFNRKNDDRQQMTNDIILKFLCTYHNGDIKAAENYINDKYVDDFPWNTVNQDNHRADILQTWWFINTFKLDKSHKIINIPKEIYRTNSEVTVIKTLDLQVSRNDDDNLLVVLPAEKVTIIGTDNERWCLIQKSDGIRGLMDNEAFGTGKDPADFLEGLNYAD